MRKTIILPAAAVLLGFLLTGCGVPANTVHSAADLEGKIIACQSGTTGYMLSGDIKGATVDGYNKGADAIQALVQGKADAVIIDSEPAKVFVSKNEGLTILDEPFAEEEYAIAYKKGNDALGRQIDSALTDLKEDGTLAAITSHWIGDDADQVSYTPAEIERPNGQLIMATNATFPPYESTLGSRIVGIDPDIMQAVCDKLGMELVIEDMEFDTIFAAVDAGKADVGAAGITVNEERLEDVSFTQTYAATTLVIVVRAN